MWLQMCWDPRARPFLSSPPLTSGRRWRIGLSMSELSRTAAPRCWP